MHELSIAEAIVAIAEEHAQGRRVAKVDVKIGHLRQVVPSALIFAFELVTQGTPIELPFACPSCGSVDVDVRAGDELFVEALELIESSPSPRGYQTIERT